MDHIILAMLEKYHCVSDDDYGNALKEIIQEIALLGLWRSKFFEHAAFYGGTALRILYQLNRFSEDLDFSLLAPNVNFNMLPYLSAIEYELKSFGFSVVTTQKNKTADTAIQSAFLKANTLEHLLKINVPTEVQQRCHARALLKVKVEVDTDPPGTHFTTETRPLLLPIPFWVNAYSLPDLFAGKLSAVLARQWKNRVKGRDWYDLLWFVQKEVPVHLKHLEERLRYINYYHDSQALTLDRLKQLLKQRISHLNIDLAKEDISHYINNPAHLAAWSRLMFNSVTDQIKAC